MSAKAIREIDGKQLLSRHIKYDKFAPSPIVAVTKSTSLQELARHNPFLMRDRLVVKPDQLIKRRGKLGLIKVNADLNGVGQWLGGMMGKEIQVGNASGVLDHFIIEPFIAHEPSDEHYLCIRSLRNGDEILFCADGGINVGDVDEKALRYLIPVGYTPTNKDIELALLQSLPKERRKLISGFVRSLFEVYRELYFTYLEINPIVVVRDQVHILDLAAKIDTTAYFDAGKKWGPIDFPPPFGREPSPEERRIAELDQGGASLKLTIINKRGRIWTMVAGGGASVIYSDTICELGGTDELANYGEYSGAPSKTQTYEYAKVILDLMTRQHHPDGKVLLIGGGIANFTNVASTFEGIVQALREYQHKLIEHKVKIYVRRGGPNYQEGLRIMKNLGKTLGVPIKVYGPETHMTAIVGMALGTRPEPETDPDFSNPLLSPFKFNGTNGANGNESNGADVHAAGLGSPRVKVNVKIVPQPASDVPFQPLFTKSTKSIVFGHQPRAIQGMLDFDYCCGRTEPSVSAIVYAFGGGQFQRFYWGQQEILIPVYKELRPAAQSHPEASVLINFASFRSAFEVTCGALEFGNFKVIAIIAEGIPENMTREMIRRANERNVCIIGPATVGGIRPGCFRIGNTGGMLDNILSSKLYREGSVAYVSRSGGMSNELNNIVSRTTNGVYEGIAIGGDRYPGTTFMDHIMRFQADPNVKMIMLLGEVGGVEEYDVCKALRSGRITKPLIAWCIGTCGEMFSSEVQFGHAGSIANGNDETSTAKNRALAEAGAIVPRNFDELGDVLHAVYVELVKHRVIIPQPEPEIPNVPLDYAWAKELGLVRKPANIVSTISDERGDELLYNGVPISQVLEEELGIGGVIGLLWFKKRLPSYACKFIETCLVTVGDHGPAVAGAHNTIVTARAGKDLISSLVSGLLTIGDRFGGALDGAAKQFSEAYDKGLSPEEFVTSMAKQRKLIMGIGHAVKSIDNPDQRVVLIKNFAKNNFPKTPLLDFALEVEKITTVKKSSLILNVDGCIAVCFVDLLKHCGAFTEEEATDYINNGTMNAIFVLGRSIGFIGHFLDQKRLKQGLYRHPWDDISYAEVPRSHL